MISHLQQFRMTASKVTLKKVAEVAEEETTELEKDLKIEAAAGDFVQGQGIRNQK